VKLTARVGRVAVVALLLALGACGAEETAQPEPEPEETSMPSEETPGTEVPGSTSPAAREAVADLAKRLDVAESDVSVDSVEEVTWRNGSLGCAQEGMMYTQALVDGSRIILSVDGTTYEYHQGQGRVFWCENPTQ
jgi:hypothetical protein